ncbi:Metallo-hydrolase/oxidoreductase [Backusella circina FSU 941]|nr:Metallo-hydrolase/oxidoreductase [Backusella circina FSU 941]
MTLNKRPSFVNFPIPFDHPYTIPTLACALTASAVLYYSLQASHTNDLIEALRQRVIYKRRHLKRNEDKFATLKIEKQFVNPFEEWKQESSSLWETLLYYMGMEYSKMPSESELDKLLPFIKKPQIQSSDLSVTWLGQSTCLFTLDGITVLTDPLFNDHIQYTLFNQVKRLRPAPITVDDVKEKVDIVLVTNNHLDHLDEDTVKRLGDAVTWYIPLGLRDWFTSKGVENVIELDWWQEIHHKERPDILIACVPAMHSSCSRTSFNRRNHSLWCSFVIKSKSDKLFFCGDTGYVPELFQAIRDLYSPFTVAALPLVESQKQSLFMSPEEAVKAHVDLGSPKISIGIHWGTFQEKNAFLSPVKRLAQVWKDTETSRFITLSQGETLFID